MRNTIYMPSAGLFMMLLLLSCKTFFEDDISDQSIQLLAPGTNIETDIVLQTFWWERIDGASNYRLQVVTPSFHSVEKVVIDTLVAGTQFTEMLFPSFFEWRVRAENSEFLSQWTQNCFKIYATSDLSRQKVNLLSPTSIINQSTIRFEWENLYNAKRYRIAVYHSIWEGINAMVPAVVDTTYFVCPKIDDGLYVWGVRAENSTSESNYTQKELLIDTTPPNQPALKSPSDSSQITGPAISFVWYSSDKTSGVSRDTLNIYSDKGLTKLVKTAVSENQTAQVIMTDRIIYYWRITSVDKAGNVKMSDKWSFTLR